MWWFIFGFLLGSSSNDNYHSNYPPIPASSHRSPREYVIFVDGINIAQMLNRYNVEAETLNELANQFSDIKNIGDRLGLNFTTRITDLNFEISVKDENIQGEYIRRPDKNLVSQFDYGHAILKKPDGMCYPLEWTNITENTVKSFLKSLAPVLLPSQLSHRGSHRIFDLAYLKLFSAK